MRRSIQMVKPSFKKRGSLKLPQIPILAHDPTLQELGYSDPGLEDPKIKIIFQRLNGRSDYSSDLGFRLLSNGNRKFF